MGEGEKNSRPLDCFQLSLMLNLMTDTETFCLQGKLLVASPAMQDPRFSRSVIYMCEHDSEHAMGLVINKPKGQTHLSDLLEQIGITGSVKVTDSPVLNGGPVDNDRGFVLHSPDYTSTSSLHLSTTLRMTATKDILESLVSDNAPQKAVLAVGYAGWTQGQIEKEIKQNVWIVVEADEALIYDQDMDTKWTKALAAIGISPEGLSAQGGMA